MGQTERNGIFFRQRNGNGLVKWTPFIGESGKQQEGECNSTMKLLEVGESWQKRCV